MIFIRCTVASLFSQSSGPGAGLSVKVAVDHQQWKAVAGANRQFAAYRSRPAVGTEFYSRSIIQLKWHHFCRIHRGVGTPSMQNKAVLGCIWISLWAVDRSRFSHVPGFRRWRSALVEPPSPPPVSGAVLTTRIYGESHQWSLQSLRILVIQSWKNRRSGTGIFTHVGGLV